MSIDEKSRAWREAHLSDSHLFNNSKVDRKFFIRHMRSPAIATVLALSKTQRRKLEILEVGTGNGYDSIALALRGHRVTSLDISDQALASARRLAEHARALFPLRPLQLEFVEGDAFELSAYSGRFDLLFCQDVIVIWQEHARRMQLLASLRSVLKPDGWLLITTMNTLNPLLKFVPLKKIATELAEHNLPILEAEVGASGFIVVKRGTVGLSPNFKQWLSRPVYERPLAIANALFNLLPNRLKLYVAPHYYVLAAKRQYNPQPSQTDKDSQAYPQQYHHS